MHLKGFKELAFHQLFTLGNDESTHEELQCLSNPIGCTYLSCEGVHHYVVCDKDHNLVGLCHNTFYCLVVIH
jgi:hypothetical protein